MKNNFLIAFSLLAPFLLTECRTSEVSTKAETPVPPSNFKPFDSEVLVSNGRSHHAQFSPDGSRIVYVSSDRGQHRNPQAYEMKLESKKERRLTFQDGEIGNVIYSPNGQDFVYTSTTDEAKEDPDLIRRSRKSAEKAEAALSKIELTTEAKKPLADREVFGRQLSRYEIYESASDGSTIDRLTSEPGFDGNLVIRDQGFTFASVRNSNFDLYSYNLRTKSQTRLTTTPGYEWSGTVSNDGGYIATVLMADNFQSSKIEISQIRSKQGATSFILKNHSLDPIWYPGGEWLLFTSNSDDALNYELYWVRRDGNCLTRATYTAESEMHPAFSKDGKQLVFTLVNGTKSSIQRVNSLVPPACNETMMKEKK